MTVFTTSFKGHWLGGYGVVVAETKRKAYNMMKKELNKQGIGEGFSMDDVKELDTTSPNATILFNGDY